MIKIRGSCKTPPQGFKKSQRSLMRCSAGGDFGGFCKSLPMEKGMKARPKIMCKRVSRWIGPSALNRGVRIQKLPPTSQSSISFFGISARKRDGR